MQSLTASDCILGWIFDVYIVEDVIHLWILDKNGRAHLLLDQHQSTIYACGSQKILRNLVQRLLELEALAGKPQFVRRKLFYHNKEVQALRLLIKKPSLLPRIKSTLHRLYRKLNIYHADIDPTTDYLFQKQIYPLAEVRVQFIQKNVLGAAWILSISALPQKHRFEYTLPAFKSILIQLSKNHRQEPGPENLLQIEYNGKLIASLNIKLKKDINKLIDIINRIDPDIIYSIFGDQTIMPELFRQAQALGIALNLDRDPTYTTRRIKRRGSSFQTYGRWIYSAPAYPLFGRWHIDHANSFVYKETEMVGILELARLSCLNVQRLARASTGNALTAIETRVAIKQGYLVPWQKSAVEEPKTAYELLIADKGGLVFMPVGRPGKIWQHVAQIDFSQMYPTIMVLHNLSPETVSCLCCRKEALHGKRPRVPEIGYHICTRRKGVVAESLQEILERRAYYKERARQTQLSDELRANYNSRQNSLKWMLVTAFGYLGYRNAKFGRIESHESVTAFGRQKLLRAKQLAESAGLRVLHGITDCLFIGGDLKMSTARLQLLCQKISEETGVVMNSDGIYAWLIFLPARNDANMPVANRYLGLFKDGEIKYRGIAARRKDSPVMIVHFQLELLSIMKNWQNPDKLMAQHEIINEIYKKYDAIMIVGKMAEWRDLLLRRTVGRERGSYRSQGATASSQEKLAEMGQEVLPGEKVRYLVVDQKNKNPARRYQPEEILTEVSGPVSFDINYYRKILFEAYREVWEYFAPEGFFDVAPGENLHLQLDGS